MMIRCKRFNLYFCAGLMMLTGCQSAESQRQHAISTLRIHLEAPREASDSSQQISISRNHPLPLRVLKDPILDESYVSKAEVVDEPGGFRLRIQFDRRGSLLLEQRSAQNQGKHLAIYSEFAGPDGKTQQMRWLAAPRLQQRIADGTLLFTPDASREESEQIALGLTNLARKREQPLNW